MSHNYTAISRWGWVFHTARGGIDRGSPFSVPGVLEVEIYRRLYDPGMERYCPRERRHLNVVPRGNWLHEPQPSAMSRLGIADAAGIFTPFEAVSTRVVIFSVPGLL